MTVAEKYIEFVKKKTVDRPEKAWGKILFGFEANHLIKRFVPDKEIAVGYQKLEEMMLGLVSHSLMHKKSYIWGNIFAPCEIFHSMGLRTLSIECLGCFLSGYHLEEFFIDYAQNLGLAPTLCSYHKNFVGSVASGVVPAPAYAVSTSLTCDGNLNTFRYLQNKTNVPFTLLDIPYTDDEASVEYLSGQLKEMTLEVEKQTGRRCSADDLRKTIEIENETKKRTVSLLQTGAGALLSRQDRPPALSCDGSPPYDGQPGIS